METINHSGFNRFENEDMTIVHNGGSVVVDGLSGWRHEKTDEVIFDADTNSAERYSEACDKLVKISRNASE